MSFNRRGGDRRPDRPDRPDRDRQDRPPRRDFESRDRGGGDRPFAPRDRPSGDRPFRSGGGDRPYTPRGGGGGDRPYAPRPRFDRAPDEGAMSIRLDPRRVSTLKHLAGEAGVRPGDLVRQWVEERLDAARGGADAPAAPSLIGRVEELARRVAALEAVTGAPASVGSEPAEASVDEPETPDTASATVEPGTAAGDASGPAVQLEDTDAAEDDAAQQEQPSARRPRNAVSAVPSERVALHDEMIAVLREHGPMSAAELAGAITERGRYTPPRSGRALDAAMVSQRVSNPTYRSRFTRSEGRIGLAE